MTAETLGLNPRRSGARIDDEGLFIVQHRYWQDAMRRGLSAETRVAAKEQEDVVNA